VRFLLDESADARILPIFDRRAMTAHAWPARIRPGMSDPDVLALAVSEDRIFSTSDRDFGDMVVRQRRPHRGVILFRPGDYAELGVWIERLDHVLANYSSQLDKLVVVTRR
jgi:predicted nuclease of predicted toxin-antitoxin system